MGSLVAQVAHRFNKTLFSFLVRNDGAVFDYENLVFVPNQKLHLTLDEATRSRFRIPYVEVAPGNYRWQLDCSLFPNGAYSIETRELADGIEYAAIDSYSVSINDGQVVVQALELTLETKPLLRIFCYIRRTYDDKYFTSIGDFQEFDIFADSEETRNAFRIMFSEVSPGVYQVNRSLEDFQDGSYIVTVYYLREDGLEIKAGLPSTINVLNNKQQRGLNFDTVYLSHDTKENDHLRYVKPNGEPISGAQVLVFETSKYIANSFDGALGITYTNPSGRWVSPIPVRAGASYTVVFFLKEKYGPDSVEVIM
jgi:hypothetical protein